jgi:hypothetical protein
MWSNADKTFTDWCALVSPEKAPDYCGYRASPEHSQETSSVPDPSMTPFLPESGTRENKSP